MRLDKFLKVSRLIKRRTVANEACDAGRVLINGRTAKASAAVKAGDVIEIQFGTKAVKVEVLNVQESSLYLCIVCRRSMIWEPRSEKRSARNLALMPWKLRMKYLNPVSLLCLMKQRIVCIPLRLSWQLLWEHKEIWE